MKNDLEKKQDEKTGRATRKDIDAANERFAAIKDVAANITLSFQERIDLVVKIAEGKTLDSLIIEAGRAALGLE